MWVARFIPDRSFLGLGLILLLVASCVPAAAREMPGDSSAYSVYRPSVATTARPSFGATEEPPPLEILAAQIAPGAAATPFSIGDNSRGDVLSALDCLTAAVYYEARSEPVDGQRAVAQVVLNRVRHPAFPKTVCGVVYQGSNRATGCQFSFTCDGSQTRARQASAWERARKVAAAAMAGYVHASVGLATHFHTTAIHPWWANSMARAVTIGAHIFYRWRGEWGDPKAFQRPYVGGEAMAAAAAPAATAEGEQAHASTETVAGVTIHRSAGRSASFASAGEGGTIRIHRMGASAASVRVHKGSEDSEAPAQSQESPVAAGIESVPTR